MYEKTELNQAIKSISEKDIPLRNTKAKALYIQVIERLKSSSAIVVDAKELKKNVFSVYYSIRNHMKTDKILDKYAFTIERELGKIYIQTK